MLNRQGLAGSNLSTVKSHNMRAVLLALLQHEQASRARLAELTGLSTTTITNLVAELLDGGIVAEREADQQEPGQRSVGRPRRPLQLVPDAAYALGVHIGIGNVRVAVADLRATLVAHDTLYHDLATPPPTVLAWTATLIERLLEDLGIPAEQVVGIGVGASGLVDANTGVNLIAPNLGWQRVSIADLIGGQTSLPVCVDNNVRAMALGEAMFGAGREVNLMAFIYARFGVGAGFVIDNRLFRGSGAGAGEIGHITILPTGGAPCRCGNSGCLETLVSEPAILALAGDLARRHPDSQLAHLGGSAPTLEQIFAAARAGDAITQAMLDERAHYMGIALASVVNILNPDLILMGGIFAQGADVLLPAVERTLRQRAFADLGERVRLRPTSFGRQAGMIGAAALALDTFFYDRMQLPKLSTHP